MAYEVPNCKSKKAHKALKKLESCPCSILHQSQLVRMSSGTNAAGLRPEETKALSERQPHDNEAGILKAIKEVSRLDEDNTTKSRADILVGIVVFMQTYNRV